MAGRMLRAMVVGASTLLGKELTEELNDAGTWDVTLLDDAEGTEAQLTSSGEEAALIQPLSREALDGADLIFFAGEPDVAREYWRSAAGAGTAIVDLTGALDGAEGFLLRSPWLSGGTRPDLTTVGIVAAHPVALMLALAVQRLQKLSGLTRLTATVLEPASQAGRAGVDELHQQTVSLLSFQSVPKDVFGSQVAFNLLTALDAEAKVDLKAVDHLVRRQLKSLLGAADSAKVRFQIVQAPVFHGYTISALGEVAHATTEDELRRSLDGGVLQASEDTEPSNLAASESGDLLISVRHEPGEGNAFWFWMAADNLRLAARNALAAAQELAALRPSTSVQ